MMHTRAERKMLPFRQPARGAAARSASLESAHQVPNASHSGLQALFGQFAGVRKLMQKKEVSDFLVIGYLYLEINCNFIYVTSFCSIQLKSSSVNGIG